MVTASLVVQVVAQLRDQVKESVLLGLELSALNKVLEDAGYRNQAVVLAVSEGWHAGLILEHVARVALQESLPRLNGLADVIRRAYAQPAINLRLDILDNFCAVTRIDELTFPVQVGSHMERYKEYSQLLQINIVSLQKEETPEFLQTLSHVIHTTFPADFGMDRLDLVVDGMQRDFELIREEIELARRHCNEAKRLAAEGGISSPLG